MEYCRCSECKELRNEKGYTHMSDCAVHNEPATPNKPCDCNPININTRLTDIQKRKYDLYKDVGYEYHHHHGASVVMHKTVRLPGFQETTGKIIIHADAEVEIID